jgi:hypothetical protein
MHQNIPSTIISTKLKPLNKTNYILPSPIYDLLYNNNRGNTTYTVQGENYFLHTHSVAFTEPETLPKNAIRADCSPAGRPCSPAGRPSDKTKNKMTTTIEQSHLFIPNNSKQFSSNIEGIQHIAMPRSKM